MKMVVSCNQCAKASFSWFHYSRVNLTLVSDWARNSMLSKTCWHSCSNSWVRLTLFPMGEPSFQTGTHLSVCPRGGNQGTGLFYLQRNHNKTGGFFLWQYWCSFLAWCTWLLQIVAVGRKISPLLDFCCPETRAINLGRKVVLGNK